MRRTKLGDLLKNFRIENGMLLKEMAGKLHVESSLLSAVECGKKKFPNVWYERFEKNLGFNDEQMKNLKEAVAETSKTLELNFTNSNSVNQRLAVCFARNFDYIDENTAKKICNILEEKK